MKYDIEKLKGQVKISYTLTTQEWDNAIDKAYNKTKTKYNLPGFRKGHAPRKMIEKSYGAGVFFDDAFNECFPEYYSEVLDKNPEIYPVDRPEVNFDDFGETEIKFSSVVTVRPEVTLGEYKGIKIAGVEYNVTDEDVDAEIKKALEKASRQVNVDSRAIQDGDIVILDYSGSVDGVKFDGGTATKQELVIGSKTFIPGFEEQMIGLNLNENKDITVKFPEDYHSKELAGKDAVFAVTVHEIKTKELPNADDVFAKDVSKFDTFSEYKEDLKQGLISSKKTKQDTENENAMLDAISNNAKVEIPQCMIESQLEYFLQDFEYRLMYQGMKLEDYFKYTGSSIDDFKKQRTEDAKKAVKTRLVIEDIIKAEKIEVSDADIDAKLTEVAQSSNKTLAEYKPTVSDKQLSYMKNDVLMTKTLTYLKDNNNFEINGKTIELKKAKIENGDKTDKKATTKTVAKSTKTVAKKE